MAATLLLIILGVAIWLAFMGMAVALVIRPDSVRITERFLCPPGTEMKVERKVKALLLLWGMFFVASLPISDG